MMRRLLLIIGATKRLQFVVIVSISCMASFIFFCCTSSGYYHLLPTYSTAFFFYFDRNLMFLICNGILAFLVQTMRFSVEKRHGPVMDDSIQPWFVATVSNDDSMEVKVVESLETMEKHLGNSEDDLKPSFLVPATLVPVQCWLSDVPSWPEPLEKIEPDHSQLVGDEKEAEAEELHLVEETREISLPNFETTDRSNMVDHESEVGEDDEVKKEEDGGSSVFTQEDDVSLTEEETRMSTEELNRKIEEFIRKMKEGIRIEEASQLTAAV